MTATNPTKFNFSAEENRPLGMTEALRTGLFQSIDNLDPDIVRQPRISSTAPSLWTKILGASAGS
ncbi:hypothetical protein OF385_16260 [Glutamicibacter sp. JL.03c]|uniref:hypothetical protein n=1 Tax=Glutamicibacter sp. JL.03c TaxID=2984842 RepID=UPI0021F6A65A|nr:hypothetical protein [Glutamicibacter sp. JL.03c]UYQ77543.1 hypothetical protein OF385_16260 [Glutamicibacter sp. JL.03c]